MPLESGTPARCTDGQRFAIRDALLASGYTSHLVNSEEAMHAARVATQALDKLAAEPPAVDPGEGARRVAAHVHEVMQPYRDALRELDQHIEPTEAQHAAISAIHNVLRAERGLELAMQVAAPSLNRVGLKVCADYRA